MRLESGVNLDFRPLLDPLLQNWPWLLSLGLIGLAAKFLASAGFKGWLGERSVRRALVELDPAHFQSFHDLYLPRPDGSGTTQIDHIVVSPFGIFVIETKNYRGWIFGGERQAQWTQQLHRRKHRFQNPLHQNHLHVRALMAALDLPQEKVRSIVFFIGGAELKTQLPDNVLTSGLIRHLRQHQTPLLTPPELATATRRLREIDESLNRRVVAKQHVRDLRRRKS